MTRWHRGRWEKAWSAAPGVPGLPAVRVSAPVLGLTGYEHHSRRFIEGLAALGVRIQLSHLDQWTREPAPGGPERWRALLPAQPARVHWYSYLPPAVGEPGGLPQVNYTMFESTRICRAWAEASVRCVRVVVPTESSRRAWIEGGVEPARVAVCPLGVDTEVFRPGVRPPDLRVPGGRRVASFRHRFLHLSDASVRKNLPALLEAWFRATRRDDDAVLVLKLNFFWKGSREAHGRMVRDAARAAGRPADQAGAICLVDEVLDDAGLAGLFNAATHYWSMSHGEGFDLPMHEAAACGLQLLAPAHSAYLDCFPPSVVHFIPVREVPAVVPKDPSLHAYFEGSNWWDPDVEAAAALVRGIVDGRIPPTPLAREVVTPRFNWPDASRRLAECAQP